MEKEIIQIKQDQLEVASYKQKLGLSDTFVSHPILLGAKIGGAGLFQGKDMQRYKNMLDGIYFDPSIESADGYAQYTYEGSVSVNQTGIILSADSGLGWARIRKDCSVAGNSTPTWDKDRELEFSFILTGNDKQTVFIGTGAAFIEERPDTTPITGRHIGILLGVTNSEPMIAYMSTADGTTQNMRTLATVIEPSGGSIIVRVKLKLKAGRYLEYSYSMQSADGTSTSGSIDNTFRILDNIPTGTTDSENLIQAYIYNRDGSARTATIPYYRFLQVENK